MNINVRNRFIIFGLVLVTFFAIIFVQLIKLTVVQGAAYAAESGKIDNETITVSGARGSILDRNGMPLAYDQKSYNVQFYKDPSKTSSSDRAYYTDIIKKTIKIIEDNGGTTIDTFVIKYNSSTGEYYFDWGDISSDAKKSREKNWRSNMYIGATMTPEQIYISLRDKYQIPSEVGYDEARKIMSVWQEVQLASWTAYNPIVIAYNVNTETVAEIKTDSNEIIGMSISESTARMYPKGSLAANVVGYLGKITDPNKLKELQSKGYSVDDLIGVSGIEETMEGYLTGNSTDRQGVEQVEVDNFKAIKNVISSTQPKQGNNVELTIDAPLQQAVEKSLAKNIPYIKQQEIKQFNSNKDSKEYKGLDVNKLKLATSGAAVVLNVNTGQVLAMASYPTFDPNLFSDSKKNADAINTLLKNPDAPLFNKAISSKDTPGSIFKMVTGLGALMQGNTSYGTTLAEKILCKYDYTAYTLEGWGGKLPHDWDSSLKNNPAQYSIIQGLEHSCDYYFFTLADRLGIDLVDKWGDKFGLDKSTGIELPGEAIGQIGNQSSLYDNTKQINQQSSYIPSLVKNGDHGLVKLLKTIETQRGVTYSDDCLSKTADDLMYLAGMTWNPNSSKVLCDASGKTMGSYVREILQKDMNIPTTVSFARGWDTQITSIIAQLIWTPNTTIQTGIGQGIVQVTPIAVARYVAAIANGGTVYETHIVDKVTDQSGGVILKQDPVALDKLDAPEEYLDAIKQGMADVVSGQDGTAKVYFQNFDYKNEIAGKTGTAQVSNIDLEDNSWFVCFAPYDKNDPSVKPEIAIAVYVPHGWKGALSSLVAQDIIQFYLDREKTK